MKLDLTDTAAYIYNESDVRRTLAAPISSSSVYISFEITPGEMGEGIPDPSQPQKGILDDSYAGLAVGFADNTTNIGVKGPMLSTFEYYESFGAVTSVRFATSLDGVFGQNNITVANWTPGNTYRLVGRLDFNPGGPGTEEAWTVWLDPTTESDLPQATTTRELGYTSIGMAQMYHYIYNFKNTQDSFLDNLRIGSTWNSVVPSQADLDGDGDVDGVDLSGFFSAFTGPGGGPPGNPQADMDGDGDVDGVDLSQAFGAFTGPLAPANVPEPTSLALWVAGGYLALRRRRCA